MIHPELLNDASLKKLLRVIPEKEFLFKQGDRGATMFIILEGTVTLTQKMLNLVRVVDSIGPGEILGEKAALSDQAYRRTLTAQAKSEVAVLEFDFKNYTLVQGKLQNFAQQILRLVIKRLDKANELIAILQLRDDSERLAEYLLFHCKHNSTKVSQGEQFTVTPAEIRSNLNLPEAYIKECLALLVKQKILIQKGHEYILTDPSALISAIPSIKDRIAA